MTGDPQFSSLWKSTAVISGNNGQESILPMPLYAIGDMDTNGRMMMAMASADSIPGDAVDSLVTLHFKVDSDVKLGDHVVNIENIWFEYAPKGKDRANNSWFTVTVVQVGDFYRDDKVNTTDIVHVINYIMEGKLPSPCLLTAADMNNDGVIDIFDVMKLINVILTGKLPVAPAPSMQRAAANGFYEDMTLAFSGNGVTMSIPNAQRFTSFQFEVEVPDNVELSGAKLIGVSTNHMVQFAKIEDNYYRVIGVSLDNSLLASNNGNNLIGLEIPNGGKLSIHNAMFVTPQGEVTYFNDSEIESGITGIRPVIASDSESAYDLLGRKVQTKDGHLPKGIYIINNKRVVIK